MLKQYGPDVPHSVLSMLVDSFSELRHMADLGQIAYPYSTREVVNIVKHLQVCLVHFQDLMYKIHLYVWHIFSCTEMQSMLFAKLLKI
jgi:hypothetical protein